MPMCSPVTVGKELRSYIEEVRGIHVNPPPPIIDVSQSIVFTSLLSLFIISIFNGNALINKVSIKCSPGANFYQFYDFSFEYLFSIISNHLIGDKWYKIHACKSDILAYFAAHIGVVELAFIIDFDIRNVCCNDIISLF